MSTNRVKAYFLFFTFISFIASCDLNSIEEPFVVASVEDEFYLDLWEDLRPGSSVLQLQIETIEEEDCTNYTIDFEFTASNSNVNVSIQEIVAPTDCNPGTAPARSTVDIGNLVPGFYEFNIDLKNTVFNKGQLSVSESRFKVDMETDEGLLFLRRELFRVPSNTIWGYIAFNDVSDASISTDFGAELFNISDSKDFEAGYYGYFDINSEKRLIMDNDFAADNQLTFIRSYDGTEDALESLISEYRQTYGDRIEIKLFNDQGKEF